MRSRRSISSSRAKRQGRVDFLNVVDRLDMRFGGGCKGGRRIAVVSTNMCARPNAHDGYSDDRGLDAS